MKCLLTVLLLIYMVHKDNQHSVVVIKQQGWRFSVSIGGMDQGVWKRKSPSRVQGQTFLIICRQLAIFLQYNTMICIVHSGRLFSRIWGAEMCGNVKKSCSTGYTKSNVLDYYM